MTSQSSPLLKLPAEIRIKIWTEVFTGHVLHISYDKSNNNKFVYDICNSPKPWSTSASPPGYADHKECCADVSKIWSTGILRVCKQITAEISIESAKFLFYSQNAFQFADLLVAKSFIFGLREKDRAAITDIRLNLPYVMGRDPPDDSVDNTYRGYQASFKYLMNYFSFIFERAELNIDDEAYLPVASRRCYEKAEVGFYYSNCYYKHNAHRMGKRWQVKFECPRDGTSNFGGISWDIGISDLKEKIRPKISLAMGLYDVNEDVLGRHFKLCTWDKDPRLFEGMAWNDVRGPWPQWGRPLQQLKQYEDLDFRFYGEKDREFKTNSELLEFVEVLKGNLAEPRIAPHPCPFFANW